MINLFIWLIKLEIASVIPKYLVIILEKLVGKKYYNFYNKKFRLSMTTLLDGVVSKLLLALIIKFGDFSKSFEGFKVYMQVGLRPANVKFLA